MPAFLSANTPVALTVTASPSSKPFRLAAAAFTVAVVLPSYVLLPAVTPLTVSALALMLAAAEA